MDAITYPYWDWSQPMLLKGGLCVYVIYKIWYTSNWFRARTISHIHVTLDHVITHALINFNDQNPYNRRWWSCKDNRSLTNSIENYFGQTQTGFMLLKDDVRRNHIECLFELYVLRPHRKQEIAASCEKYIRGNDTQVSLMIFSSEFKLVKPFVLLSFIFESTDRYNVFHMTHT